MNYANDPEAKDIIKRALKEDIGRGDITTQKIIPKDIKIAAVIIAKEEGIVCGIDIAKSVFKSQDNRIKFSPLVKDGDRVTKGKMLAKLSGLASNILSSERVALNFLGFLSGIATRTRQFVECVRLYNVKIMDTRKTLPGLRKLEKYAVKVGGGCNHRLCLDEMALLKDNHLQVVRPLRGGFASLRSRPSPSGRLRFASLSSVVRIKDIIDRIKKNTRKAIKIEVEVNNLREFKEALKARPDIIMLDNMKVVDVERCVQLRNNLKSKILRQAQDTSPKDAQARRSAYNLTPKLEASGNINFRNIRAYATTGIDFISLGTLTRDIRSLDVSLEVRRCYV